MFNRKTKLKLTDFECNLLWGGLNEFFMEHYNYLTFV